MVAFKNRGKQITKGRGSRNFVPDKHQPLKPSKALTDIESTLTSMRLAKPDGSRKLEREKHTNLFMQHGRGGKWKPLARWETEKQIRGTGQKELVPGTYIIWNGKQKVPQFLGRHPMGGAIWTPVIGQAQHFSEVLAPSFLKAYKGKPLRVG